MLKISTICSVLNSEKKINILINSFLSQNYKHKELIIVDGGSTDKTINILKKNSSNKIKYFVKKKSSIYSAINFGIKKSSGQIINIMGDNDFFFNKNIYKTVIKNFHEDISYLYGDTEYVNDEKMTVRYYSSKNFNDKTVKFGFMPSHTTLFLKKNIYKKLNYYDTKYFYASDFEFFYRLILQKKLKKNYLPNILSRMSLGGVSNKSIKNILKSNYEVYKILKKNGVILPSLKIFYKLLNKVILLIIFNLKKIL